VTEADLLLRNGRLVYGDGRVVDGGLVVRGDTIDHVFAGDPPPGLAAAQEIDAHGLHVLPGLIDPHVQLYPQPGFAHYATETGSAALGGVTTIIKMHRDLEGYDGGTVSAEVAGAEGRAHVDFAFHLAIMTDAQITAIPAYARDLGVTSFKLFTAYKGAEGVPIGIQGVDDGQLFAALAQVAGVGGVALVHCENQELAAAARRQVEERGGDGLRAFAESRPWLVEAEAVRRVSFLASVAGCPLYVVHVTSKEGLEALSGAKREGRRVFIETEPHYLTETADSPAGALAKVIPPIREQADNEALWAGLATGEVDAIGSDHVSAVRERKRGAIWDAQLGFPGVGTILPVLLSEGVNRGRLSLARLAAATSTNPARIFGLHRKGALLPGYDADFAVVDLELERTVDAAQLGSTSDFSIYEGRTLRGWPALTACRGRVVARDGELVGAEGHGRFMRRTCVPAEACERAC
jgi:dihydropyrimidinase